MTEQHRLTPPPELLDQWVTEACPECRLSYDKFTGQSVEILAARAVQWGAAQELEACIEWLFLNGYSEAVSRLCAARRPKPPNLKEQALETLKYPKDLWSESEVDTIRRALEALPDD